MTHSTPRRLSPSATSMLAALDRHPILTIEGYCNGSCDVRQVTVRVKNYDKDFSAHLQAGRDLVCPVCQTPLTIHAVRTLPEQDALDRAEARRSVNTQIAERDRGGPLRVATLAEMSNDALPPTAGTPEPTGTAKARAIISEAQQRRDAKKLEHALDALCPNLP